MKEQEQVPWGYGGQNWVRNTYTTYLINTEIWQRHWDAQEGQCKICGVDFAHPLRKEARMGVKPEVDHDHRFDERGKRKVVRGLLCRRCNQLLGKIADNLEIAQAMMKYLEEAEKLHAQVR